MFLSRKDILIDRRLLGKIKFNKTRFNKKSLTIFFVNKMVRNRGLTNYAESIPIILISYCHDLEYPVFAQ